MYAVKFITFAKVSSVVIKTCSTNWHKTTQQRVILHLWTYICIETWTG